MGVILEKECRHVQAMKCFKNAYDLENFITSLNEEHSA